MIAYKFLAAGGRATFSKRDWPLPSSNEPGAWLDAAPGPLAACRNGVHACEARDLAYWLGDELWQVELAGEQISGPQSLIARRGRLVRRIDAWNPTSAGELARVCLQRAERFVADLPAKHGATATAEILDHGAQYLATARSCRESGAHAVSTYSSAMAFTLLAASAVDAFHDERRAQSELLRQALQL